MFVLRCNYSMRFVGFLHTEKFRFRFWRLFFILDGCSFHVAHVSCKQGIFSRKKNQISWLFRCNQMPSTNRNAWFTLCVRIVKWATIYYKNHEISGYVQIFPLLLNAYFYILFFDWFGAVLWTKMALLRLIKRVLIKTFFVGCQWFTQSVSTGVTFLTLWFVTQEYISLHWKFRLHD